MSFMEQAFSFPGTFMFGPGEPFCALAKSNLTCKRTPALMVTRGPDTLSTTAELPSPAQLWGSSSTGGASSLSSGHILGTVTKRPFK